MKKNDAVQKVSEMLGDKHIHISDTQTVKIQVRRVFHKFTEIEIQVPSDVKEVGDWIMDNENLWSYDMAVKNSNSKLEEGSGEDCYDGMDDCSSEEWRYEVEGYGGHL